MAGAVAVSQRLPPRTDSSEIAAPAGGRNRRARVLDQGGAVLLAADPGALDDAALSLRPIDGAGLERIGADRAAQRARHRVRRGGRGRSDAVMQGAVFIFLGVVAILSSLGVVMQRNPIHCLLSLIITLISIGALFIALGAVTVGFLQIIVYVGAILVLFLFVIWLLNLQSEQSELASRRGLGVKFFATIAVAGLAAELFTIM